jgi:ATP-dependent RNA helicase DHX29
LTYIKIKGKLFEIDPDAVDAKPRKQPKGAKGQHTKRSDVVQSPAVRKLLLQLQKLESDALFDDVEAEAQWPVMRNQIAQTKAAQRLEQRATLKVSESRTESSVHVLTPTFSKEAEASLEAGDAPLQDDDSALLGDMFSAVPDEPTPGDPASEATPEHITLRDFGKQSGLSPRRVLEETVRARFVQYYKLYGIH